MKTMHIFGGANGSGKSTIANDFCEYHGVKFINADDIASNIKSNYDGNVDIQASKMFIEDVSMAIRNGADFALESTLSSKTLASHISDAKAKGFSIILYYVFLDDAELAISRIRTRAAKGGHSVPDATVVRRMQRSVKNFNDIYCKMCNQWHLYYNGGSDLVSVADYDKKLEICDSYLYSKFTEISNENS